MHHLLHCLLYVCLLTACSTVPVPSSSDNQLSGIVGVWMYDELASTTTHVASRTHYYADGTFVADYRISHPGSSSCFRETGHWNFKDGLFVEESLTTTNPRGRKIPKLSRRITSVSKHDLHLASDTGIKAHLHKGSTFHPKGFKLTESGLLADLAPYKMRGFIPVSVDGRPDQQGWRVECTMIERLPR